MNARKNLTIRSLKRESREGRKFTDLFLVLRKNLTATAAGRPYLRLTLADSSDSIEAFVWEGVQESDRRFREGDVIEVRGSFKLFQGAPQIVVESLSKLGEEELQAIDPADFMPASKRPRKEMWHDLCELLVSIRNPYLSGLVQSFLSDPAFCDAFQRAPAATGFHHAYVGGLLEHTLGVCRLATALGALYGDRVNPEILLAGAFLHDVGKVEELSYETTFDYTDAGRLVGHIVLGAHMVRSRATEIPGFPDPLLLHLEHLVISHHGEKEWGSPALPQTLEGIVLHFLDNIDAKIAGAWEWMEKERESAGRWSSYWKGLGRQLFLKALAGPDFGEGKPKEDTEADIAAHFLRAEAASSAARGEANPPEGSGRARLKKPVPGQGDLGF